MMHTGMVVVGETEYKARAPGMVIILATEKEAKQYLPITLLEKCCVVVSATWNDTAHRFPPDLDDVGARHSEFSEMEILALSKRALNVRVEPTLHAYIRDLVVAIRCHPAVQNGITAAVSQDVLHSARAFAALCQLGFVIPDMLPVVTRLVVSHRVRLRAEVVDSLSNNVVDESIMPTVSSQGVVEEVLADVSPLE